MHYVETDADGMHTISQFIHFHDAMCHYISIVYRPDVYLETVRLCAPQFTISTTIRWADDD